jgi:hypothetical protein
MTTENGLQMNPENIGTPAKHKSGHWVQTERTAHEAWANLIARKPRAAQLLHHLVAQMGHQNAVVVSQKVLAQLMGVDTRTVSRSVAVLVEEHWVQVVRIGKGKEAAYVVNDRVAWGQSRDQLRLSTFSATVIADLDDQEPDALEHRDLRRIPTLYPGERQLPSGTGLAPPSQPALDGLEPDLPAVVLDEKGRQWEVDPTTGELQGKLV